MNTVVHKSSNIWSRAFIGAVMALVAGFASTLVSAQAPAPAMDPKTGITRLDPPQPVDNDGKIEVLEFFAYGCIACANIEPQVEAWLKTLPPDVKFRRVPAGFRLMGTDDLAMFYTLEAMGQLDRIHKKIFDALHSERVTLGHKPTLLKWLEKNGVDPKKYEEVEKSFTVQTRISRARAMVGGYKVISTPTFAVHGRFTAVGQNGGPPVLTVVDRLVADVRTSMNRAAAPAAAAPAPAKAAPAKAAPAKPAPATK